MSPEHESGVGPAPWFEVRASRIHGLGGFALGDIAAGTRIAEYTGERIGQAEADHRYVDEGAPGHVTYLFTVDQETVIDGGVEGNDTRFINHSCAPNCRAVVEDGRIYVDALVDIPAGAELTYDYRLTRPGRYRKTWDALYACHCGAPSCRGTMLWRRPKRRRR
jgi:SET domain-containing protein